MRDGAVHVVVGPGNPPTYHSIPRGPESQVARLTVDAALQHAAGRTDVWQAREEHVARVGSRYIDWLVPGLIGMNIMGTGMWGIGFSVVAARNQKLLKRLMATPMRRGDYLLAQMLARLVFLVARSAWSSGSRGWPSTCRSSDRSSPSAPWRSSARWRFRDSACSSPAARERSRPSRD